MSGVAPCVRCGPTAPTSTASAKDSWKILVAPLDETDAIEWITLDSSEARVWIEPAGGVVVETGPTGFGDFRDQRIIPWSRLLDFRKTGARP